jgi:uncharacterized membrane protein
MHTLLVISVALHLLAVVLWAGGLFFFALAVVPLLRQGVFPEGAGELVHRLGLRFRPVAWVCFGVLVVTGVVNLWARGLGPGDLLRGAFWASSFGVTLAHKLALVAALLGVSAWHDFSVGPRATAAWRTAPEAPETKRLRRAAGRIGRLNVVLALAIIVLGVLLARGA